MDFFGDRLEHKRRFHEYAPSAQVDKCWTHLQVFPGANTRVPKSRVYCVQSAACLALVLIPNYHHWAARMAPRVMVGTTTHTSPSSSITRATNIDLFGAAVDCYLRVVTNTSKMALWWCKEVGSGVVKLFNYMKIIRGKVDWIYNWIKKRKNIICYLHYQITLE